MPQAVLIQGNAIGYGKETSIDVVERMDPMKKMIHKPAQKHEYISNCMWQETLYSNLHLEDYPGRGEHRQYDLKNI